MPLPLVPSEGSTGRPPYPGSYLRLRLDPLAINDVLALSDVLEDEKRPLLGD